MLFFHRKFGSCHRSRNAFLALVIGLFIPVSLNAQTHVVDGEYLVLRKSHRSKSSRGMLELRRSSSALLRSRKAQRRVPYDRSKASSYCENLKRHDASITHCEPNFYVEISNVPNDYNETSSADMKAIDALTGWSSSAAGEGVVVAVLDTGVDYTHPDLRNNVWINEGEIAANGIDDDGNGYIDDIYGLDAFNGDSDPMDDHGHGTHVAGTIGATGNNGIGIIGVAPNVKIMSLKFLGQNGGGTIFGALKLIEYAQDHGASVINASWGGTGLSTLLGDAVANYLASGGIFIAAAGNSGTSNDIIPHYPSNFPGVISVAATDNTHSLTYFSNYGTNVSVAAPGLNILSTLPGANYGSLSGTSMAAPHVSGLIALLKSEFPDQSVDQITQRMLQNGRAIRSTPSKNISTGRVINVALALGADGSGNAGDNATYVEPTSFTAKKGKKKKARRSLEVGGKAEVEFESLEPYQTFTAYINLSEEHEAICAIPLQTGMTGKVAVSFRLRLKKPLNASRQVTVSTDTHPGISRRLKTRSGKSKKQARNLRLMSSTDLAPATEASCANISASMREIAVH